MREDHMLRLVPFVVSLLIVVGSLAGLGQAEVPGGWIEKDVFGLRAILAGSQIQSFVPSGRGPFTFPLPYGTQAVRLTDASDCQGGGDCLFPLGYSYWRNSNNHVGSNDMYLFFSFDRRKGGAGPTLFRYDKAQDAVVKVGPLFEPTSKFTWSTGEGWYFSARQPTTLYMHDGPALLRYDVVSHTFETVVDVSSLWGHDKYISQVHSSNDDRVHSMSLGIQSTGEMLGCVVYHEQTKRLAFFGKVGVYDECHVDKGGQWLMSQEDIDGRYGLDMRIFDTANDTEVSRIYNQDGGIAHADLGYGYVVGTAGYHPLPNASVLWFLGHTVTKGPVVHSNVNWSLSALNHISHSNAKPDVPPSRQFACGSNVDRVSGVQNEITCVRMDGSPEQLIVAPVMTSLDAPGGQIEYNKMPKGNLDITGQYFIWTTNLSGNRLDAFLVKIPSHLLLK
jgi:hypothetical protein